MTTSTLHGRRVFYYFLLFFVVIIAVNAVMMTLAIRSHSGLVTSHPYEKGLAYNTVVDAANAQDSLGWKAEIAFNTNSSSTDDVTLATQRGSAADTDLEANRYKEGMLTFLLKDAESRRLIPDTVTVHFMRPTQAGMDFSAEMKTSKEGAFFLIPEFPAKGLWEARIYATVKDTKFQQSKRIVVE